MGNVSGCCRSSATIYPVNPLNLQLVELRSLRDQVRRVRVTLTRSVESAAAIVVGVPKNEPVGTVRYHHRRGLSQMRVSAKWLRELDGDISMLSNQISGDETARAVHLKVDAKKIRHALVVADDVSRELTASLFQHSHGTATMPAIALPPSPVNAALLDPFLPFGVSIDVKVTIQSNAPAPISVMRRPGAYMVKV